MDFSLQSQKRLFAGIRLMKPFHTYCGQTLCFCRFELHSGFAICFAEMFCGFLWDSFICFSSICNFLFWQTFPDCNGKKEMSFNFVPVLWRNKNRLHDLSSQSEPTTVLLPVCKPICKCLESCWWQKQWSQDVHEKTNAISPNLFCTMIQQGSFFCLDTKINNSLLQRCFLSLCQQKNCDGAQHRPHGRQRRWVCERVWTVWKFYSIFAE